MYAEDTTKYVSVRNKPEVSRFLHEDLSRVNEWLYAYIYEPWKALEPWKGLPQ